MNNPFIEMTPTDPLFVSDIYPIPEIKPIEGYELPVNKETGEQLPNCCPFHKELFERAEKWFEEFPNCCEEHKKFIGKSWFKKENYNGIAEKIVRQLSYTEHQISEQINNPDWYKYITDYIEWNRDSFPKGIGFSLYSGYVQHYIRQGNNWLSKEQRQRLLSNNKPNDAEKSDFNILYSIYQKWLKEFPFELDSYFGNLKQHFENNLPLLKDKPETNIYTGLTKAKMQTKSGLIEALINLTKELLSKINVREMVEKGIISDLNKHRFELESESLRIATSQITKDFSKGELQYIKALKKWLNLHKQYFKEIAPLLKTLPPQNSKAKTEHIITDSNETNEMLFEKIKGWEVTSQVEFAVSFVNPKRKGLFEKILAALTNETQKHNIKLIVERIEKAAFNISGYTNAEIEHYQSLFAIHFFMVLHNENYHSYIEDKIRELLFYCKGLEQDLRTKQYELIEDREQDKTQLTEAERYKIYLENLLIHLNYPAPQQAESKTDKINAPVLAFFCYLINESGINKKDENESVETYCKRICDRYGMTYTDRIRQNYNGSESRKNRKTLSEILLPLLDTETKDKIQKHLNSKYPPNQNLYA